LHIPNDYFILKVCSPNFSPAIPCVAINVTGVSKSSNSYATAFLTVPPFLMVYN